MRYLKLSAVFLLLALASICFIAVPAFSGDTDAHPWDADDEGGKDIKDIDDDGDSGDGDTTIIVNTFNSSNPGNTPPGDNIFDNILSYSSFFISNMFFNYQPETVIIITSSSPQADQNAQAD